MKVGDLIKHKYSHSAGTGIITKTNRNGPPGFPVYVEATWSGDWFNGRSVEQQYLEVISESR